MKNTFKVECPACGHTGAVPTEYRDRQVRCKHCGASFRARRFSLWRALLVLLLCYWLGATVLGFLFPGSPAAALLLGVPAGALFLLSISRRPFHWAGFHLGSARKWARDGPLVSLRGLLDVVLIIAIAHAFIGALCFLYGRFSG